MTSPRPDVETLSGEVRRLRIVTGLSAVAAVVALVLAGWSVSRPASQPVAAPTASVAPQAAPAAQPAAAPPPSQAPIGQPAAAGDVPPGTIALGAVGQGKPVVDVYEDYQCPACAQVHRFMGPQVDQVLASGTVEVRFHPMSFLDQNQPQGNSWRAAKGAFCANDQGKFIEYHNAIWPNQQALAGYQWTPDALQALAQQAGLDGAKWAACMATDQFDEAATQANTVSLERVQSTPTFLLNGTKLDLTHVQQAGGLMAVVDQHR